MRDTELFQAALGLSSPWIVLRSEFNPDQKQLDLHIGLNQIDEILQATETLHANEGRAFEAMITDEARKLFDA